MSEQMGSATFRAVGLILGCEFGRIEAGPHTIGTAEKGYRTRSKYCPGEGEDLALLQEVTGGE
ncbi:MAG: hypothetical protein ACT4OP_10795 [Actinomycetota bacterium]